MTEPNRQLQPSEIDQALKGLILQRTREINGRILTRLGTVSDDLDGNNHLGAIGGLDGLESEIVAMRSLLLLLR